MRYRYSAFGSSIGVPAQVAGEEIERIRTNNGGSITPKLLVDQSRPEDAALHPVFEWDDPAAAESYRVIQAKEMIRSVVIVRDEPNLPPVRAFVSVRTMEEPTPRYTSIACAMEEPEMRQYVLKQILMAWRSFQVKYGTILDLTSMDEGFMAEYARAMERAEATAAPV